MPHFTLKQHRAVWETTTVQVEAPNVDYIKLHADELLAAALEDDTAEIASGDLVENVESEFEVYDEHGTCVAGAGAIAMLLMDRPWMATYCVCDVSGDQIACNTVQVNAPTAADAEKKAIAWANDNDPYCDERIDYVVQVVQLEIVHGNEDEQVDPAG